MKSYDFNVSLFGKMQLTVIAEDKEDAKRIIEDTINNLTIKDIELRENRYNDIEIKNSEVNKTIKERNKEMKR